MTKIEWVLNNDGCQGKTWNPITGCIKVSPGCKHCYADTLSVRLKAMGVKGYEDGFDPTLHPDRLEAPLKRKKPTMYFVCSMSDLFQDHVPFDFVDRVMDVIERTPQHTYQILTKRAGYMHIYFSRRGSVPKNAWLGVSVENTVHGLPRIEYLRGIEAPVRFLSCEPLLEDISRRLNLAGIHWVIVGGESGPGARPMEPQWARHLRDRCSATDTAFFMKQMAKKAPIPDDLMVRKFPVEGMPA